MDNDLSEVVQQCGPWLVRLWRPIGTSGGPQRLTIEPGPGATARDIARGISTTVLRRLDLSADAPEAAPLPEESQELAQLGAASGALLDSEGVSLNYLSLLALTYKQVADSGATAPIPWLASVIGRRPETIKDQLKRARREGLLTTVAGKAGGDLTPRARAILDTVSTIPAYQSIFQDQSDDSAADSQSS